MGSRVFRYAPLGVFGIVYTLSCVVGGLFLILSYEPFVVLFEYFSGTAAPKLSAGEVPTNLLLLFVGPLALAGGYVVGMRVRSGRLAERYADQGLELPRWLPHVVFWLLAAGAFVSLARAGALGRVDSWIDYGSWIESRSEILAKVSFFEFVNIYILLPMAAAWVVVAAKPTSRAQVILRWVPVPVALALSLLLFMRKAALTVLLIVIFAWAIDAVRAGSPRLRRLVLGLAAFVLVVYLALVVVPVYSQASRTVNEALGQNTKAAQPTLDPEREARLREIAETFGLGDRRKAIFIYSLLSPFTRSSAPALYYPVVFPREHDYFRLDVGLDILGSGSMPNDNVVVWNYLNPNTPGGTTMVPYQFVLYSQIGTFGAIIASALVGLLLALLWRLSQAIASNAAAALAGSMVLLLATYVALDSLRNSVVVSYGVIWGMLFAAAVAFLAWIPRNQPSLGSAKWTRGPATRRS